MHIPRPLPRIERPFECVRVHALLIGVTIAFIGSPILLLALVRLLFY